jgi:hypothetical protein
VNASGTVLDQITYYVFGGIQNETNSSNGDCTVNLPYFTLTTASVLAVALIGPSDTSIHPGQTLDAVQKTVDQVTPPGSTIETVQRWLGGQHIRFSSFGPEAIKDGLGQVQGEPSVVEQSKVPPGEIASAIRAMVADHLSKDLFLNHRDLHIYYFFDNRGRLIKSMCLIWYRKGPFLP